MVTKVQEVRRPRSLDAIDKKLSLWLHEDVGRLLPRLLYMTLEHSGNGILWLLFGSLAWFYRTQTSHSRMLWLNFFLGLWVDIALVGSLKMVARRERPEYNKSADFMLVVSVDRYSFPSGHAARVSFVATYAIAVIRQLNIPLTAVISMWAVSTATSRALMGRHYIGDVIAGLLLGLVTTGIVTKFTYMPTGWISEIQSEQIFSVVQGVLGLRSFQRK